jgi:hypothetical protein
MQGTHPLYPLTIADDADAERHERWWIDDYVGGSDRQESNLEILSLVLPQLGCFFRVPGDPGLWYLRRVGWQLMPVKSDPRSAFYRFARAFTGRCRWPNEPPLSTLIEKHILTCEALPLCIGSPTAEGAPLFPVHAIRKRKHVTRRAGHTSIRRGKRAGC